MLSWSLGLLKRQEQQGRSGHLVAQLREEADRAKMEAQPGHSADSAVAQQAWRHVWHWQAEQERESLREAALFFKWAGIASFANPLQVPET